MAQRKNGEVRQELKLYEAAQTLLDECRMVLPGIQALFGFQLIAVFNQRFEDLGGAEQGLHLIAIALVAVAIAIVMTPAAFHRHQGSRTVSSTFIHVTSFLLLISMVPLAVGLCIDFYVIARLIFEERAPAIAFALALFVAMGFAWFVFPRMSTLHRAIARLRERGAPT
jgi:DMSO reductase anchor subunit